jgi:hypothetical protein
LSGKLHHLISSLNHRTKDEEGGAMQQFHPYFQITTHEEEGFGVPIPYKRQCNINIKWAIQATA